MTREEIQSKIIEIFREKFEIENPGLEDNLREEHKFDSIDAIDLLVVIEDMLETSLSQDEKKLAMEIRNINQIVDFVVEIEKARS
ncbi:MAG: phosphopantetheine-binding protein [Pseudomonadota bacterium]